MKLKSTRKRRIGTVQVDSTSYFNDSQQVLNWISLRSKCTRSDGEEDEKEIEQEKKEQYQ